MNRLPALHCAAVVAFMALAAAGLGFAAFGPVALIRTLGLVAVLAAVGGGASHAMLVRAEAPECWERLVARFALLRRQLAPGRFSRALEPRAVLTR